jgi:hypothetical protein
MAAGHTCGFHLCTLRRPTEVILTGLTLKGVVSEVDSRMVLVALSTRLSEPGSAEFAWVQREAGQMRIREIVVIATYAKRNVIYLNGNVEV